MHRHPNLTPVEGVAGLIDTPTEHTYFFDLPNQAAGLGPRMILPEPVVRRDLQSIAGMSLCALTEDIPGASAYSINAPRRKVGLITEADIRENRITVKGFVYGLEFPDVVKAIKEKDLGLCLNLRNLTWEKEDENTIRLTSCLFVGANIMLKPCCGFQGTNLKVSG